MKRQLVLLMVLLMQQLWAQSENQPLQRSIEVDPLSKSLLKVPEDNALPGESVTATKTEVPAAPTEQSMV